MEGNPQCTATLLVTGKDPFNKIVRSMGNILSPVSPSDAVLIAIISILDEKEVVIGCRSVP